MITYVDHFLLGAGLSSTAAEEELVRCGREPWGTYPKQTADRRYEGAYQAGLRRIGVYFVG